MEQTGVLEPAAAGDKPVSPRVFKTAMAEAGPYVAALAIVLLTTALAEVVFRTFGTNKLSMIFLLGVVLTAIRYGAYPAYFAAGAAFMFYNFDMVTPRFTIRFASAEDVITLIVFFVVAMLTAASPAGCGTRRSSRRRRPRPRTPCSTPAGTSHLVATLMT